MVRLFVLLVMLSASFWETKAPVDWTDDELIRMFTDSPWAQMVADSGQKESHGESVQIYLASAAPMVEAETQRAIRYMRKANGPVVEDALAAEKRLWLEDNRTAQIVLAVRTRNGKEFDDAVEVKRMEEETVMHVGRKKYKMTGHFPPTAEDPYLRIAFPRQVAASDKTVSFDLYIPGVRPAYRMAEFKVKDLMVKGKLEL